MKAGRLWPVSLLRWGGRQAVSSPGDRGRLPSPRFCRLGPAVLRGPRRSKVGKAFPPVPAWRSGSLSHTAVKVASTSVRVAVTRDGKWPRFPRNRNHAGIPEWDQVTPESAQANCRGGQGLAGRRVLIGLRRKRLSVVAFGSWLTLSSHYPGAPACVLSAVRPISPTKRNAAPYQVPCQGTGAAWPNGLNVRCTR